MNIIIAVHIATVLIINSVSLSLMHFFKKEESVSCLQ